MDSISRQTMSDFEVVFVNDGSTDSSPGMLEAYSKKDFRLKVIHKENGGLSSARNAGFKAAIGEYVHFLDSDDWLSNEEVYQKIKEKIVCHTNEESVPDILIFRFDRFYENTGQVTPEQYNLTAEFDSLSPAEQSSVISRERSAFTLAWNKIVRREFLIENNIEFDIKLGRTKTVGGGEDNAWNYDIFSFSKKAVYFDEPALMWRLYRRGAIITIPGLDAMSAFIVYMNDLYNKLIGRGPVAANLLPGLAYYFLLTMVAYSIDLGVPKSIFIRAIKENKKIWQNNSHPRVKQMTMAARFLGWPITFKMLVRYQRHLEEKEVI